MTRERIIDAACELAIEIGIKSTTMDDIARKAGVSKKTLYKYFKDKTDLVRHAVLYVSESLNKQAETFVSNELNPIRRLYAIDYFYSHQPIVKAHSPQKQLQKFYPKIYKEMQDKELEIVGSSILKNLQKGIEMGLYRQDIDL
ncbi:MAG: TetR/AcrR family transcriptional regulator, partial [Capnocytophaga sp.]|nr:TetR/AcrR family transcriptional regulator [Capnocytophaga sp.]